MSECLALVQRASATTLGDAERRAAVRHAGLEEGVSRPLEGRSGLLWGTVVRDLSETGVGLSACFPFRPGTVLSVDLQGLRRNRSLLARVVHTRDEAHGTFHIGCEFIEQGD